MTEYLAKLRKATGYKSPIFIAVADPKHFADKTIGITSNPDGFLHVAQDGYMLIVLRDDTQDSDRGRNLICHEFMHALHWPTDKIAYEHMSSANARYYAEAVEKCIAPFHLLLRLVDHFDIEWEDGDE